MEAHDDLVMRLVESLEDQGAEYVQTQIDFKAEYTVLLIGGHVPDVSARFTEGVHLYEVEAEDTINDPESHDRWRAFSDHAKRSQSTLHIVVPKGNKETVLAVPCFGEIGADVMEI
jgi:hypothetical protein